MSTKTPTQKSARALQRLTLDETGKKPAHMFCLGLAEKEARLSGEPIEVWAARVFEHYRDDLTASADRKQTLDDRRRS